ncbi:hypothetical protein [Actinophytocola sp.]|uniref:hypothetical protein n=1 Tax=Actinophytocola sp. TaxID=1872138 RepID=UPI00389A35DD
MAATVTVRLYPLAAEHLLPMAVDAVALCAAIVVWGAVGLTGRAVAVIPLLVFAVLVHVVQMYWVAVRFDDTAITIIRPWRRRRIEWSRVAGLMYSSRSASPTTYRLHLVFRGAEPPFGRYLSNPELMRYATGPVVMTLFRLEDAEPGSSSRAGRCANQIMTELARHGFPPPAPRILQYRSPEFTAEEWMHASAEDMIRRRDEEPEP